MSDADDSSSLRFLFNEGSLPADIFGIWDDQTVNVLRVKGEDAHAASLVISRETIPVGVGLSDYVDKEISRLQKNLRDFTVRARLGIDWSDGKGTALLCRWMSDEGSMDQITTCRVVEGRRILIFTGTHATPMPDGIYRAIMNMISGFVPRAAGDGG